MDFLNNLLAQAAGYFGAKEQADAKLELARLGVNQAAVNTAGASNVAAAQTAQWIPGVSNGVVIAAGAGLLALAVVVVVAKK